MRNVKQILNCYMGTNYALTEAKGWKSLPTKRDFHGWHGDSWYDQDAAIEIHKEVKLALYLTDVRSGAFNFIKGSHRQRHPYDVKRADVKNLPMSELLEVKGKAGTAFVFDSSAIHRQGYPWLEQGIPLTIDRRTDKHENRASPALHFQELGHRQALFIDA